MTRQELVADFLYKQDMISDGWEVFLSFRELRESDREHYLEIADELIKVIIEHEQFV
jgi:hypothetical protein